MKQARLFLTFGAVFAFSCIAISAEPAVGPPVVGHEFKGISVPGVTGVFWTRRNDHFTLQVQFDTPPSSRTRQQNLTLAGVAIATATAGQAYPDVRVQLRDRNGAV